MSTTKSPNEPNAPAAQEQATGSINEPPGSNVGGAPQPAAQDEGFKRELLPSDGELHKMTRAELDELAEARGVDISEASNKDDVIELLRKDARKRR